MLKKQLLLFIFAVVILTGFFFLPPNRKWATERIFTYYREFPAQKNRLDRETRMSRRFGNSYTLSKEIARQFLQKSSVPDALILIPPPAYFTRMGIYYPVPEPAVFYYYTGLKTIWPDSKDAITARWYVRINDRQITVDSVTDKRVLQDTITAYQKWK